MQPAQGHIAGDIGRTVGIGVAHRLVVPRGLLETLDLEQQIGPIETRAKIAWRERNRLVVAGQRIREPAILLQRASAAVPCVRVIGFQHEIGLVGARRVAMPIELKQQVSTAEGGVRIARCERRRLFET